MCAILLSNLYTVSDFHLFGESRQLNRAGCLNLVTMIIAWLTTDAWISTIRKRSSSEKAEKGKEAKEKEKEKGGRKAKSRPLA